MRCPNCNSELEDTAKECYVCGYIINLNSEEFLEDSNDDESRICSNCGLTLNSTDEKCPVCGMDVIKNNNSNTKTPETDKRKKEFPSAPKYKLLLGGMLILVIMTGALIFLLKSDLLSNKKEVVKKGSVKKETEQIVEEEQPTAIDKTDASDSVTKNTEENSPFLNKNSYLGYWNMRENQERELTIQDITEKTVTFSLWYYRLGTLQNTIAILDGNVANFSNDVDGDRIKGTLTFNDNSISVKIIESERTYMPVEFMEFEEKHLQSWSMGDNDIYSSTSQEYEEYSYDTLPEYSYNNYYILPDSSWRTLTIEDIYGLSSEELLLARNEIYARHGRIFTDSMIRAYFESQEWYQGTILPEEFTENILNDVEKANIEFIKSHE